MKSAYQQQQARKAASQAVPTMHSTLDVECLTPTPRPRPRPYNHEFSDLVFADWTITHTCSRDWDGLGA